MKKDKIFIISEAWDGCFYYRAEVFARYSKKFQVKTNVNYESGLVKNAYECLDDIFDSDVVIFVRPTIVQNFQLLNLLKEAGKTVVFSGDDSFSSLDKKNPAYSLKKKLHINEAFLKYADFVITTTESLKEEYETVNKKVLVIPNLIDFDEYRGNVGTQKAGNKLRIGLVGSVHTAENSEKFIDILKDIYSKYRETELIFFGNDDTEMVNELKTIFHTRAEFVPSVPITEYAKKLADLNLDIALIPRKDNQFNRSKSNCKYLEMSALGIATIAQGFRSGDSPYQHDIVNGENGYIAIKNEDWVAFIKQLREGVKLSKVKNNAGSFVKERYDIKSQINLWDDNIQKMVLQKPTRLDSNEIEMLKLGLVSLYRDKWRDERIKNYKEEVSFLNGELDRIRGKAYYRFASKIMDIYRGLKKNENKYNSPHL